MNPIGVHLKTYEFFRGRTLTLLESIEKEGAVDQVLLWRPGPGRAHIGWQVMHIGVTEEIFATERLAPEKDRHFEELWPRFRGGSTPDENLLPLGKIRELLAESRRHLVETLSAISEERLDEIPAAFQARGLRIRDILSLISWHEAHHQGQAHLTFNLYKAQHG